jgi:TolB protein
MLSRLLKRFAVFALFALFMMPLSTRAQLHVDVTRGIPQPLPVAITAFQGSNSVQLELGRKLARVVEKDLKGSGLFKIIDKNAYIQNTLSINDTPRFGDWRVINAQALVHGAVTQAKGGQVTVEFRLWDVFAENQMIGRRFQTTQDNWRQLGHMIADAIYTRLTGEEGYFNTRIVYIAETGPANKRIKRLAIMDQDGANHRYLTSGQNLVLTPRFSPTSQQITYMSYGGKQPAVYLYNLSTNRRELLGNFPGMTFAPRFSPDGEKVIMSMAQEGNTDIYTMDLSTQRVNRLTTNRAIDTAPTYSPDGRRIVFESDRGGSQQLYVMNSDGSNAQRISFGKGLYANPVWSPRGDLIAFTKIRKGQFYIGVIRPDGSGERLITKAFHVEGPTWSPNGRVLMYFKEKPTGNARKGRQSKIYTVDLTGANERLLPTPIDGSDPAWSPLLN